MLLRGSSRQWPLSFSFVYSPLPLLCMSLISPSFFVHMVSVAYVPMCACVETKGLQRDAFLSFIFTLSLSRSVSARMAGQ